MEKMPDIKEFQLDLADILARFPIGAAYLFGSYAEGTQNQDSDLDIALVLNDNLSPLKMLKIEMQVGARLDKKFRTEFDIRCINNAPLRVKGEIVTRGRLIYCADEDFRISFETFVRARYFDFLPSILSMRRVYFTSIKSGGLIG